MKRIILLLNALIIVLTVNAQECKNFYYLTKDAEIVMTLFDNKGNENGKQVWKVDEVKQEGGGLMGNVKTEYTDRKGKDGAKGKGVYRCQGGVLKADMQMYLPGDQMQAYKNMDVKADEVYIEYPVSMTAGQALTDGNFKMQVLKDGQVMSNITFKQVNRKAEGKESVTTPAGTWEAYKISYDGQFKASMGNSDIGIPANFKITEWFVPGFGIVKSETYSRNGKLMGSSQITSIKK